jgi:hypothetical protein
MAAMTGHSNSHFSASARITISCTKRYSSRHLRISQKRHAGAELAIAIMWYVPHQTKSGA